MARKIKITCDSTCDLSEELLSRYDISVCPLSVVMGDKAYRDGIDAKPDDIYAYYAETGKLAKSAAVNIPEYEDFFNEHKEDDTDIIHFCISSEMSTTYNNARLAAASVGNVYVIDSANLSTGSGLLALKACDMREQGMSTNDIVAAIEELKPKVDASFVIDSLLYLYKGGRCSGVAALGANLLKLKPCIEVKNGAMGVGKKYRGKFEAVLKDYAAERLDDADNIDMHRVFITHAGCDEKIVNEVAELVKKTMPFEEVLVTRAGCTVSTHCGRNTLGVLFIRKNPIA